MFVFVINKRADIYNFRSIKRWKNIELDYFSEKVFDVCVKSIADAFVLVDQVVLMLSITLCLAIESAVALSAWLLEMSVALALWMIRWLT